MAEILHHLRYMKPFREWDKLPTSTGERRISSISMNHGSHRVRAAIASKVYLGLGLPKGGAFFDGTML